MESKRRILIIGASILQLPAILKAKEMGLCVGVVDYNPNAIGVPYADEYFNVSTIDVEGVTIVAQKFHPDGIMTLATDMPVRSIAAAGAACGLPCVSAETALKATDKAEMIKAFEAHGVEHPWYYIVGNKAEYAKAFNKISFPCILKPTDNSGSRGVVLVHDCAELDSAYRYAQNESRNGAVIIEEYLEGPEFSVEIMVIDGEPYVLQITDKLTTGAPHFVEMGHSQPSMQNMETQEKIRNLAVRAVKAIGIQTGPAHVEIILTREGPKMVELGARMGGDCITTHLVPLSTGIDFTKATIDMSFGITPDISPKFNRGSAIRFISPPVGVIKQIIGEQEAREVPGIKEVCIECVLGQNVGKIENSASRIGYVIAQGETAEEAVHACNKALSRIHILLT